AGADGEHRRADDDHADEERQQRRQDEIVDRKGNPLRQPWRIRHGRRAPPFSSPTQVSSKRPYLTGGGDMGDPTSIAEHGRASTSWRKSLPIPCLDLRRPPKARRSGPNFGVFSMHCFYY